jgi:hypothetical protein
MAPMQAPSRSVQSSSVIAVSFEWAYRDVRWEKVVCSYP